MLIHPAPLAPTATALRRGELDLLAYINEICDRIDAGEPHIQALLPEPGRRARLLAEAKALLARFPDPADRPLLYGIPVGIKDMFFVDGFPMQAGSQLPLELFVGQEGACVRALRGAGALILGKTVTTEFAYFEPGPTRNPHNLDHTPGGSSSGSAAAVAAGFCPLAIGTQTIGSTIRPAAFCGIAGFKPSYGRIPTDGMVLFSQSVDTIGLFTQDMAGMLLAAPIVCQNWQAGAVNPPESLPVVGVPEGPYLEQASPEGLGAFEKQLVLLADSGYTIRRVRAMEDIAAINHRHTRLTFAEMAKVHAAWFAEHASLYRPRTAAAILEGQEVSAEELAEARAGRIKLRAELEELMAGVGIDLWVCPSAPGPAPEGLQATGSPLMNLPWTHAGMPAISVPAGRAANGLPLGLQCIARFMADEQLLGWVRAIEEVLRELQPSRT